MVSRRRPASPAAADVPPAPEPAPAPDGLAERVERLETAIAEVREELRALREELGA